MYHSQYGEDRIIHEYFGSRPGFYVEVGASNGVDLSNTCFFEKAGWSGVLVEANPETAALCRANRPRSQVFNCAIVGPRNIGTLSFTIVEGNTDYSGLSVSDQLIHDVGRWTGNPATKEVRVEARTLDDVLEKAHAQLIDFVTIDVEGHEWGVLEGFTLSRWAPKFIILERNQVLPDPRIMRHLHAQGYRYVRTTGVNDWFQPRALTPAPLPLYRTRLALFYYLPKYLKVWLRSARGVLGPIKRKLLNRISST